MSAPLAAALALRFVPPLRAPPPPPLVPPPGDPRPVAATRRVDRHAEKSSPSPTREFRSSEAAAAQMRGGSAMSAQPGAALAGASGTVRDWRSATIVERSAARKYVRGSESNCEQDSRKM